MKIKNFISVLLGLGIVFIGGEKIALQGKATSIKPSISNSTIRAFNYELSNSEVSELTNSGIFESENDESSFIGEDSSILDVDESSKNSERDDSSLDSGAIEDFDSKEEDFNSSNGISDLSEASSFIQSVDEYSSTSSTGDSTEFFDSTGNSLEESSLAESSLGMPAETNDRSPIGITAVMLGISGIAGIALTIRKKK